MLRISIKWNTKKKRTPGGDPSSSIVLKPDVREYRAQQEALRAAASSPVGENLPELPVPEDITSEKDLVQNGERPISAEQPVRTDKEETSAEALPEASEPAEEIPAEAESSDSGTPDGTELPEEDGSHTASEPEEENSDSELSEELPAGEPALKNAPEMEQPDAEIAEEILRCVDENGTEPDGFVSEESAASAPPLLIPLGEGLPDVEVTEEEILRLADEIGAELDGFLPGGAIGQAPPLLIQLGEDLPDVEVTEEEILRLAEEIGGELDGFLSEETVMTGTVSGRAAELYELWGLNRSPVELEKERRREELRRKIRSFLKGAAVMLLIAAIGTSVWAYLKGWRINLFYEITDGIPAAGRAEDVLGSFLEQIGLAHLTGEGGAEPAQQLGSDSAGKKDGAAENGEQAAANGAEEREREFLGMTVSNQADPGELVNEGPTKPLEDPDQVTVEENGPVQTVEVERAMNIYLSVDGSVHEIRILDGQAKNVGELLTFAGVKLDNDDYVEPVSATPLNDGDTVRVTRVRFEKYTETEVIPGQAVERMTPCLRPGRTYAINEAQKRDGEREVTYLDKYVNGELESHEEIHSEVTKEPTDYILLVGAEITASPINGAQYTDVQVLDNVPTEYSAVYSGRCTAYNFKPGSYGASGMFLSQGMVAVDPSLIPYGSLLYITSANGKFVYGWAIAADYCEASAAGIAVVDLFFDTYRESALFGARTLNVYVVEQLYQGDLAAYIAKEGMFRSRVPA